MNSLMPVDTEKWELVTPVYFSVGPAAALLLVPAVAGALGGVCAVVGLLNAAPPPLSASSLTTSDI